MSQQNMSDPFRPHEDQSFLAVQDIPSRIRGTREERLGFRRGTQSLRSHECEHLGRRSERMIHLSHESARPVVRMVPNHVSRYGGTAEYLLTRTDVEPPVPG